MNEINLSALELRNAILTLNKTEYPRITGFEEQNFPKQFAWLKRITIDYACSVLQRSEPDPEYRPLELIKEFRDSSAISSLSVVQIFKPQEFLKRLEKVASNTNQLYRLQSQHAQESDFSPIEHMTETIYIAHGQLDAQSVRLFLETYGFQVRILQESAGVALGLTVGALGEVDIRVAPEDAEQAKEFLQAMVDGYFVLTPEEEEFFAEDENLTSEDQDELEVNE